MSDQLEDIPAPDTSSGANKPLFDTVNLLDPRLCVQDQLDFAVSKGAQNTTKHNQGASSASPSNINFEVVLPSLSTIIDRKMMIRGSLTFTSSPLTADQVAAIGAASAQVKWGTTETLAALPFDACVESYNLTINSQSFTYNSRSLRDIILRQIDENTLLEYSSLTPTALDKYAKLSDASGKGNGVFGDYSTESNYRSSNSSYNNITITYAGPDYAAGTCHVGDVATIVYNFCEPLYFSPLILDNRKDGAQGLYGVQGMTLAINMNASNQTCKAIKSINNQFQLTKVDSCFLECTFLTPHASLKLPARNMVPYLHLTEYTYPLGTVTAGTNKTATSNSINLQGVPDYAMLCCRKKRSSQGSNSTDTFLPLAGGATGTGNLNVSYGNQSGYFSGNSNYSLYEISKNNGVNIKWNEFVGSALVGGNAVNTVGALIKIDFSRDGLLNQDWLAPSSISSTNFMANMTVVNNTGADITDYEMVVVVVHSGFIVTSLGSSSRYLNVLDKVTVLQCAQKEPVNKGTYDRIYGGSFWSSIKSGFKKVFKIAKPLAKIAKPILSSIPDARAQAAAAALNAVGAGITAAGATKFHGRVY